MSSYYKSRSVTLLIVTCLLNLRSWSTSYLLKEWPYWQLVKNVTSFRTPLSKLQLFKRVSRREGSKNWIRPSESVGNMNLKLIWLWVFPKRLYSSSWMRLYLELPLLLILSLPKNQAIILSKYLQYLSDLLIFLFFFRTSSKFILTSSYCSISFN